MSVDWVWMSSSRLMDVSGVTLRLSFQHCIILLIQYLPMHHSASFLKTKLEVHREIYFHQHECTVCLIHAAKQAYYRSAMVSATTEEAHKFIKNLTQVQDRPLPSHDTKLELVNRFVELFRSKVARICKVLDVQQSDQTAMPQADADSQHWRWTGYWRSHSRSSGSWLELYLINPALQTQHQLGLSRDQQPWNGYFHSCWQWWTPACHQGWQPDVWSMLTVMDTGLSSGVAAWCLKHADSDGHQPVIRGWQPHLWSMFPILKNPGLDNNILKNYRPVSNIPFLGNVMERPVAAQPTKHLESITYMTHCSLHTDMVSVQKVPSWKPKTALTEVWIKVKACCLSFWTCQLPLTKWIKICS